MRVHLIKKQSIEDFVRRNPGSAGSFSAWYSIIRKVDWHMPQDILSTFRSADILGKGTNRVVFNIGGNAYRMICTYYFGRNRVHLFVKWIGTHDAYSKVCDKGRQYTIDMFG